MNQKYIYNNGTISVGDEYNNYRPISYSDNFKEILEEENIIEELENNYENFKLQLNEDVRIINRTLSRILIGLGLFSIITILFWLISGMSMFSFVVGVIVSFTNNCLYNIVEVNKHVKAKRDYKVLKVVIEEHKKIIKKEKEKLEELKKVKTIHNKEEKFIDGNIAFPTEADQYSNLLYETCSNIEKLTKYCEKGNLDKLVIDKYCHVVEKFIKENAPKLIRKK